MRIAQVIPSLGRDAGGPSRSVYELCRGLRALGEDSIIVTLNHKDDQNIASEGWIHSISVSKRFPFGYNSHFKHLLKNSGCDLLHIHSLYNYPVTYAARYARRKDVPYIISPRGTLYEAAINNSSSLKKRVFNRLFLLSDLNHADAIHATCIEEMKAIRTLGVVSPIAVIPNSISVPEILPTVSAPEKFRLCYLGRINPIKNLDGLLKAWDYAGLSQRENAELVIIGNAHLQKEQDYLQYLHSLEKSLCISNIQWKGSLLGKEKDLELNSCSFLVLPSHSENFGMVVIEALLQGVPVLATKGTPWEVLEKAGCGWWIDNTVEDLGKELHKMSRLSSLEKRRMGLIGQQFVCQNYSTIAVCNSLKCLYDWVDRNGEKPSFVYD